MQRERRAVIDVGTNSIKLLVADVQEGGVAPVLEKSWQTRLGRGFYESQRLPADAVAQTAVAAAEFARLARQLNAVAVQVIATSAAREAVNQHELLDAVQKATGLPMTVISGDQEAEWVFQGVISDSALAGQRLLILDVGGGSSEFILGAGTHHSFRQSFAVGAVRLFETLRPGDPPSLQDLAGCRAWLKDFFNREIAPALESAVNATTRQDTRLVGTGGTTTILACMAHETRAFDRQLVEGTRLSQRQVLERMVQLWSLPLAQRMQIVGLPPNRADIILTGVAIYEAVMEHFAFAELHISTRGLRFGALLQAAS